MTLCVRHCIKCFPCLHFLFAIIIPIVQMGKLRLGELTCPRTLGQRAPIGLYSDSEVGAGATCDITAPGDRVPPGPGPKICQHPSEPVRAPPRALGDVSSRDQPHPPLVRPAPPPLALPPSLPPSPSLPGPVRPIPLPAGSLRPCRVGLRAAGRRRPDRRAHARTDGRTHGGPRARTARAGAPRPAREGWGRAQVR